MRMRTAATPASNPAYAKALEMTRLARTPIRRAASKSSLAARTESPNSVRRNTTVVITRTTAVAPIVTRSMTSKRMPAIVTVSNTQSGPANDFFVGPANTAQQRRANSCSRANEVSSIVNGLALRTQRKATRSVANGREHGR